MLTSKQKRRVVESLETLSRHYVDTSNCVDKTPDKFPEGLSLELMRLHSFTVEILADLKDNGRIRQKWSSK